MHIYLEVSSMVFSRDYSLVGVFRIIAAVIIVIILYLLQYFRLPSYALTPLNIVRFTSE